MLSQRTSCILKMIAATVCWGGSFVAARIAAPYAGPATLTFVRFTMASCVLIFMVWRAGEYKALTYKTFSYVFFLSLTGVFAYNTLFFWALQTTSASRASLIINTNAILIAMLAVLFLGERLSASRSGGIVLATCGAIVLLSNGNPLALFDQGFVQGDLLMLGCIFSWAIYTLISKKALPYFTPTSLAMWTCCFGTILTIPLAITEGFPANLLHLNPRVWPATGFLAIFATALAFKWYSGGIQLLGVARTAVFINLIPISAVTFSMLFLGEQLEWPSIVGGCMTITGTWLTNRV